MKLTTTHQIEVLGELIAPQWAFGEDTTPSPLHQPKPVRVTRHFHCAVIVERVMVRHLPFELVTPVINVELHNATHRLPLCFFGEN